MPFPFHSISLVVVVDCVVFVCSFSGFVVLLLILIWGFVVVVCSLPV